jgi:hypothetical protein
VPTKAAASLRIKGTTTITDSSFIRNSATGGERVIQVEEGSCDGQARPPR